MSISEERPNDDLLIVREVLAGRRDAYAELVRRHQAKIVRLCTSMLKNATDAEDAAQDVFVKAFQSLADFRQTSSFYTWLYRIASNHCLTLIRSRKRHPTESLDGLFEVQGEALERFFASHQPDPRSALESAQIIDHLLSKIKPNYKLILMLREVEGLSYDEIGQVLGKSLDGVKSELKRAREEIEQKFRHFSPRTGV